MTASSGRSLLWGPRKRLKRDLGELAWAIPALNDVQNNVTITSAVTVEP